MPANDFYPSITSIRSGNNRSAIKSGYNSSEEVKRCMKETKKTNLLYVGDTFSERHSVEKRK